MYKKILFACWLILFLFLLGGSVLAISKKCSLQVGKAYKYKGNSAVYFITTKCTKQAFSGPSAFFTYFKAWKEVKSTTKSKISKIPNDANFLIKKIDNRIPSYQTKLQIPTAPSVTLQVFLNSDFLKKDPIAQKIILDGITYNLESISPYSKYIGVANFAYKIYNALIMLGYNPVNDNYQLSHLSLLHRFQKNNGFAESGYINKEMLIKIDNLLQVREVLYKTYSTLFTLYNHTVKLDDENISKDYIAALFSFPITVLPDYLQLKTEKQYVDCIKEQCVGSIKDQFGNSIQDEVDLNFNYVFYPDFFSVEDPIIALPKSASVNIFTVLHEYGHYIDGLLNDFVYSKTNTKDSLHPSKNIVDTKGFYEIAWDVDFSPNNLQHSCAKRKEDNLANFITLYAYDAGSISNALGCPSGQYRIHEEFADSFAAYVATGKAFRKAASQNEIMKQKYTWLKEHVFNGIEYDTDLSLFGSKSCENILYINCASNDVWDGQLKKL